MPKINNAGLELVKSFEGCVLHSYQDSVGIWTSGYGHTSGVRPGQTISQAEADQNLHEDLSSSEEAVQRLVKVVLTSNQFSALVSFVFNLGEGSLASSTLLRLFNSGETVLAAKEFLKWDRAGGVELPGLTRRRTAEMHLFLTPEEASPAKPVGVVEPVYVPKIPAPKHDPLSAKDIMKEGDIHVVCSGRQGSCKAYDFSGKLLFQIKCLMEGVHGSFPPEPDYSPVGGDTLPGLWKMGPIDHIQPPELAYGAYYIYLTPLAGECRDSNRSGLGFHCGGSNSPDPFADNQGLYPTLGCVRVLNGDMRDKVIPLVSHVLNSGKKAYLTTTWA